MSCSIDESCDDEREDDIPKQFFGRADAPVAFIHGSFCSPELLSHILYSKYDGYNKLKKVTRCGCWVHARRKFVEALPADKELVSTSMVAKGVNLINDMYDIERSLDELPADEKHKQRQERLKPALDMFFRMA